MGANGIVISTLDTLPTGAIFQAFSDAFSDYEMQLNRAELESMLKRRGFVPELSFGAFHEGKLVSFTFNGIGDYHGEKTAYDTGTGTVKEFRGQGLASGVFRYSIPFLKKAGVSKYLLEVLQHNRGAVSVYSKLGFKVSREFNYFSCARDDVKIVHKASVPSFDIRPLDLSMRRTMEGFWDFSPSWQNDFNSIHRSREYFRMMGAFQGAELLGYAIIAPASGDVTQIAVKKSERRKGIATSLLKEILKEIHHTSIKVINTDIGCSSITGFLEAHSLAIAGTQYEMQMNL